MDYDNEILVIKSMYISTFKRKFVNTCTCTSNMSILEKKSVFIKLSSDFLNYIQSCRGNTDKISIKQLSLRPTVI